MAVPQAQIGTEGGNFEMTVPSSRMTPILRRLLTIVLRVSPPGC
jgi:hypothetical protein